MSLLFSLIAHLLVTLAKLARPGGLGAVAAESLAVKHQLLIMKRARRRAPYLTSWDRLALGVCTLLVSPKRLSKMAVILKPSTLLYFHRALVKRKYRLLYSTSKRRRPGPKGPSRELIDTVVEIKRRNPRFGCRKIAEQISSAFGIELKRMWFGEYSFGTTDRSQAAMVLRGSLSSATLKTACGVSTSFVANRLCSKATGSWWCWTSSPAASSASVSHRLNWTVRLSAGCSIARSQSRGLRDTFLQITIRCSAFIDGLRTCVFSKLMSSNQYPIRQVHRLSSSD